MLPAPSVDLEALTQAHHSYSTKRQQAIVPLHVAGGLHTALSGPEAPDRAELELFVKGVFRMVHSARIRHFMPTLMSMRDDEGHLQAVCGIRHAAEQSLFLETYLDQPVELMLSAATGKTVTREQILEVGNLAVFQPVHIRHLLASVSLYLHGSQAEWAVFTATPGLRNALLKLNMQLVHLGVADIQCLPAEERPDWGRYYDHTPQVLAVRRMQ
jgi:hypothetical protein